MSSKRMHQTTVRFGSELWQALEAEAASQGVSVAQYVREAALARVMYQSGRRGDAGYEEKLEAAGAPATRPASVAAAGTAREQTAAEFDSSAALWAQGRQARRRAQELREQYGRQRQGA